MCRLMGRTKNRGRNESIRRVLSLARRLEGLRYAPSLQALAVEFQVNKRTVYRDLELLESLDFKLPIWRFNEQLSDFRVVQRSG